MSAALNANEQRGRSGWECLCRRGPTYANDSHGDAVPLLSHPRFTSGWAAEPMQDSFAFLILWAERFREDQASIKMVPPGFFPLLRGQSGSK